MAGNHTLGTIRGTIEIDYDGAGIVKAVKDVDRASSSMDKIDGASRKAISGFASFARGALLVTGAVGSAYNVLTLTTAVLATVGPLAGAAFAAAPAVILGYAAALTIAKVAVAGVGDALSTAAEGGEKFDEAMKKLSPEAQKFVRAYKAALPVLEEVQKNIQNAFFQQLNRGGGAGSLLTLITGISQEADGVSDALGRVANRVIQFVSRGRSIKDIETLLIGVRQFLLRIQNTIGPVIGAFVNLAAQAAAFGAQAGGSVASALESLAGWLNSIDVAAVFERAGPILSALGQLFSNIGIIVSEIFGMFNVDGASSVSILSALAASLATFLQSAEGQAALTALGHAIQTIGGVSGEIFMAFLQAVTPVLVALAPAVAQLATQIASVLVPALAAASPILTAIATYLAENMSWIGPLAGAVVAAAAAYRAYALAAAAVSAVQAALNSAMIVSALGWIRNTAAIVANRIALAASAVVMGVVRAATIAWTAAQWLLNTALLANPIGLIILAIVALVAAIVLAWKNSETFRNIVMAVWKAIQAAAKAVADWFMSTLVPSLKRAWDQLVTGLTWAKNQWMNGWNLIKNIVRVVWNAIVAYIRFYINTVKAIIRGIIVVYNIIRDAFNRAVNIVKTAGKNIIAAVKALPGQISGALGNLGRLLYTKGVSLVQGFINGIGSMIGRVRDKARSIVSSVTDFLPGSPAKEGPLSGRGYALLRARRMMADFARGLEDGSSAPVRVMLGTVTPMSRLMAPSGAVAKSRAFTADPSTTPTAAQREYPLIIGGREFARIVVDAVTGEPVAVSKASSEGSRRTAWAGNGRKI
jgi:hypothetical protein